MFELAVHEVSKIAFACLVLLRPRYLLGLHIPPSSQPQSWRMALDDGHSTRGSYPTRDMRQTGTR